MTQKTNAAFGPGDWAYDSASDDEKRVLIVGVSDESAADHYVPALDETVASFNRRRKDLDVPDDDPVYEVLFVDALDDSLKFWSTSLVFEIVESGTLDNYSLRTYDYPESALELLHSNDGGD